jgi:hypothetical protein
MGIRHPHLICLAASSHGCMAVLLLLAAAALRS